MASTQSLLAVESANACGTEPGFFCELLFDLTGNAQIAEIGEFLVRPAKVVLILLAGRIVNRIAQRLISQSVDRLIDVQREKFEKNQDVSSAEPEASPGRLAALRALAERRTERNEIALERNRQRAETLGAVLRSGAAIAVFSITIFMALAELDINLGPLIAGAGVVGVAIGFGAQSLVKDFLSGIFMLVESQYGVGDIIDVGDVAGVVEEVKLRTTKIRDINGTLWHVPNGQINRVANSSQEWARAVLDVEVSYDTDISHAMDVIKRVAVSVWEDALDHATVLEEPQIWGVQAFGDNSIAIRLALKAEPAEQWAVAREVRKRLKDAFDDEGIEIPFPQRTVWLHQANEPSSTTPSDPPDRKYDFTPVSPPEGEY